MPVTKLDEKTALVVIDMQRGIMGRPTVHPAADVLGHVVELVDAFRKASQPVVLVNVGFSAGFVDALQPRADASMQMGALPPDFSQLVDELLADPARDILVTKRQWGAFYGTELDLQLRRRHVTGIVLCGIATSIGVESTARAAFEHGYNLTFASDAMTDMVAEAHENSLTRIFPRIGEVDSTKAIIAKL
jgi:nicotinamidase-related amidase